MVMASSVQVLGSPGPRCTFGATVEHSSELHAAEANSAVAHSTAQFRAHSKAHFRAHSGALTIEVPTVVTAPPGPSSCSNASSWMFLFRSVFWQVFRLHVLIKHTTSRRQKTEPPRAPRCFGCPLWFVMVQLCYFPVAITVRWLEAELFRPSGGTSKVCCGHRSAR